MDTSPVGVEGVFQGFAEFGDLGLGVLQGQVGAVDGASRGEVEGDGGQVTPGPGAREVLLIRCWVLSGGGFLVMGDDQVAGLREGPEHGAVDAGDGVGIVGGAFVELAEGVPDDEAGGELGLVAGQALVDAVAVVGQVGGGTGEEGPVPGADGLGEEFQAGAEEFQGPVGFDVEDFAGGGGVAEEVQALADAAREFPGQGGLADGGFAVEVGDAAAGKEGVAEPVRGRVSAGEDVGKWDEHATKCSVGAS